MFTGTFNLRQFIFGSLVAVVLTAAYIIWAECDPQSLLKWSLEDGPIENLTALLFGLSSLGFVVIMCRSRFLREKKVWWRYLFVLAWALLMFVFMGEEISWGQRLFGFSTPDGLASVNAQKEFNLHNLESLQSVKYRMLSLMMLITGVLLPLFVLWEKGRRLIQTLAFPVMPIAYMCFFIFSYCYGKYYYHILPGDAATEVRELLLAVGMFAFAWHGALRPGDVFRLSRTKTAA